ncbi:MAG: hypothetical protein RMY29_020565, partial [Nostoc sp. CreGUA01]
MGHGALGKQEVWEVCPVWEVGEALIFFPPSPHTPHTPLTPTSPQSPHAPCPMPHPSIYKTMSISQIFNVANLFVLPF